ncbi:MAB_1171c family putative transporter, partial [Wenjunlia tyrosinilytica]|uniref:MAB_1171c family putative transporter n=1 Tax=Wenjunlia tyrosinilytica TaxID=1544741 RepID=UPI001666FF36
MSETPYNVSYLAIAALATLVVLSKLRALKRDPTPTLAAITAATACGAIAFFLGAPVIYRAVAAATGAHNLATLGVYSFVIAFGGIAQVLVLLWASPRTDSQSLWDAIRPRVIGYVLLLAAMATLFFLGDTDGPETPLHFDVTYADEPTILAFMSLYQAGYLVGLLTIAGACHRQARQISDPHSAARLGLRLVSVGCLIASGYAICKAIALTAAAAGNHDLDFLSDSTGPAFAFFGSVFICIGFWLPVLRVRWNQWQALRTLRPLWQAVHAAAAELSLDPGASAVDLLAMRDLEWHLDRRMVEIRDAQRELRRWMSPKTEQHV